MLVLSIIKSVTTIMKLIDKTLTGARAIFDGLAMMLNDNPALFSLLKKEGQLILLELAYQLVQV